MTAAIDRDPHLRAAYAHCAAIARRHTENFTVASWFLPRDLWPHFYALYAYCRGVDDLGDEAAGDRLALLDEWERELDACYSGTPAGPVFRALQATIRAYDIPPDPFRRLIEANRRDQVVTSYPTYADLLDYCTYSANPVGHLVLSVFGYRDAERRHLADQICTALQLTNFWQDVARDRRLGRTYIPLEDFDRFGYPPENLDRGIADAAFRRLLAFEVDRARSLFAAGAPLLDLVRPELRVDLRLFSLGGLAVLDAIERAGFGVLTRRPTVPKWRRAALVARALAENRPRPGQFFTRFASGSPRPAPPPHLTTPLSPGQSPTAPTASPPPELGGLGGAAAAPPTLEAAYQTCWAITKQEAKNFYYGFVALPAAKRRAIYAAYAFSRRVDDQADAAAGAIERAASLAASRRDLAAAYAGAPGDPVMLALSDAVRRYRIPQEYFEELLTGVEMDLTIRRYETFEDLRLYCYRVASVVGLICLEIFGYRGDRAREHAIDLGIALQLTNILRDVEEDAGRDRIYLPLDEMRRFGVSEADVLGGRPSPELHNLIRFQAGRAALYHERGRLLLPYLDRRSRACVATMQGLYATILGRIVAADHDVFAGRVSLSGREKMGVMARSWLASALA